MTDTAVSPEGCDVRRNWGNHSGAMCAESKENSLGAGLLCPAMGGVPVIRAASYALRSARRAVPCTDISSIQIK